MILESNPKKAVNILFAGIAGMIFSALTQIPYYEILMYVSAVVSCIGLLWMIIITWTISKD